MKTIPQRELRNQVSRVLREVEAGERMRITVDGRHVADLVPPRDARRSYVSRADVLSLLRWAPLDPAFAAGLATATVCIFPSTPGRRLFGDHRCRGSSRLRFPAIHDRHTLEV